MKHASRTNYGRASRCETALAIYKAKGLGESGPLCPDTVVDFLTDLSHYAQRMGWSMPVMTKTARGHFVYENKGNA